MRSRSSLNRHDTPMTRPDIAHCRLHNQRISAIPFRTPSEVVEWLVAVQAQDYAGAKWALGLRASGVTDGDIDQALAEGAILRTHVMRPTWHFVTPKDIRWLLALTAPRVHAANAYQNRRLELDKTVFKRSNAVLTKALRGGKQLTRVDLASAVRQAGIDASHLRLGQLIMNAELDGVICSGARRGKQFTYALLDERVPVTKTLDRDAALAELTRRYFSSHGPATEEDFMWWSGLTRADVRSGLAMVNRHLTHDRVDGKTYWFAASMPRVKNDSETVYLLPNYDEYVVGYTDRGAIFNSSHANQLDARNNSLFQDTLIIHGEIAGTWKRTLKNAAALVKIEPFGRLRKNENQAIASAVQRYGRFLEFPAILV